MSGGTLWNWGYCGFNWLVRGQGGILRGGFIDPTAGGTDGFVQIAPFCDGCKSQRGTHFVLKGALTQVYKVKGRGSRFGLTKIDSIDVEKAGG